MIYSKTYKKTNPRSVRGAHKKGWHIVQLPTNTLEKFNISWAGLEIWAIRQANGNFVTCFPARKFAFENIEDASWFTMKWCL